jgi:hypothetical protein
VRCRPEEIPVVPNMILGRHAHDWRLQERVDLIQQARTSRNAPAKHQPAAGLASGRTLPSGQYKQLGEPSEPALGEESIRRQKRGDRVDASRISSSVDGRLYVGSNTALSISNGQYAVRGSG